MLHSGETYAVVVALLFAVAAGLVGSFALMKRMLLASDVISHVTLPGLGLAFLFGFNPLIGGGATLLLGALLIWQLQKKTGLATDAMIGVVFAASVAIGAVLTPKEDLVEALFGRFQDLSLAAFLIGIAAVLVVILVVFRFKDELILGLFAPELAAATGVKLERLNLYFLLAFSLSVLVGLRFLGALLAGALIILPATTGRRLTDDLSRFLLVSCLASVVAVGSGFAVTRYLLPQSSPGPVIVIISAILFALSLLKKPASAQE
jgi:ABC-type Mn2+/Zn2+ transport system permease subunit